MADAKKAAAKPAATKTDTAKVQKAGQKGPASSLETGVGSPTGAGAGGDYNHEAKGGSASASKAQTYSVQVHTDEDGLEVFEISAESGDEAAQKALAKKGYKGTSIRGVTPASDPDPNSLGGERDASIMIANAENGGDATRNLLGTAANAKATEELGKHDIEELGE
jgi:hypothetical protein